MSDMTAEQVWALVKDWPTEARDKHVVYRRNYYATADFADRDGNAVEVETVINASVGSGLAWLAEKHNAYMIHTTCFKVSMGGATHRGDNPLEAVSSAVLAAAKEGT